MAFMAICCGLGLSFYIRLVLRYGFMVRSSGFVVLGGSALGFPTTKKTAQGSRLRARGLVYRAWG